MNRTFKIIFNKFRNCLTVTNEASKNKHKKAASSKKLAAVATFTGTMLVAGFTTEVLAVEITNGASSASQYKDDGQGLMIYPGVSFDGEGADLSVTGVVSGDKAIQYTRNGSSFTFGLQNQGIITNLKSLTVDSVINYAGEDGSKGYLEVGSVTITKNGSNAMFINDGEGATVVLNGSVNVDSTGYVNNTKGAVMTLNGENAVIGAQLANDYNAILNINANTTMKMDLWNVEGAILNIADGVTVTVEGCFNNASVNTWNGPEGGEVNAGQANIVVTGTEFSNTNVAEIGSITVSSYNGIINTGNLTVNNAMDAKNISNGGILTYKGNKTIGSS